MKLSAPNTQAVFVAAETETENFEYYHNVVGTITTSDRASYVKAGKLLNKEEVDVVLLQHEFGLFGGTIASAERDGQVNTFPLGEYVFDMLAQINAPVMSVLHTVIPQPDRHRRDIMRKLAEQSACLITMSDNSKCLLTREYGIDEDAIHVIPHGVPAVAHQSSRAGLKALLDMDPDDMTLTITGLIGPNKGVDTAIWALPGILRTHPRTKLYVVGQTHPNILAAEGERYRKYLIDLSRRLGVQRHVVFVNQYLPTEQLMQYMQASDIYLTLHRDPDQAASGTLAYAIGAGLVAVSTPYRYAREVLSDGRGYTVPFEDHEAVAETISRLLRSPKRFAEAKARALEYGQSMSWPIVSRSYLEKIAVHTRMGQA